MVFYACEADQKAVAAAEAAATAARVKAEKEAKQAAIEARNIATTAAEAEDDLTQIRVVPIEVTGDTSEVELEGMFFDEWGGWTEDSEPVQSLELKKEEFNRSTRNIIGRFNYKIDARAKIVYQVYLDGKLVEGYGTGLPYEKGEGSYETILFKYPNGAKNNKAGWHIVDISYALITGIAEKGLGLIDWGQLKSKKEVRFGIKLVE